MTYDHELILIGDAPIIKDEIGNEKPSAEPIKTPVLCDVRSIGRNEFYGAAAAGLKPEIVFVIHSYEYSGQQRLLFDNKLYKVIRTYGTGIEEIELTCERVVGK